MKKFFRRLISLFLLVVLCIGAYYAIAGYRMYQKAVQDVSVAEKVKTIRTSENYIELDKIPDIYEDAVVSVEDHRFYKHKGIDVVAILRSAIKNMQAGEFVQGGSTITQQLAKNLFFTHEKTIERKFAELFAVYALEDNYAKNVILELYINTAYYGDGYYCIRDAAQGYFGVLPQDMTEYECTLLAGIPNAPSVYAPTKNIDLAKERQKQVLDRMVACRAITQEEKEEILLQENGT